MAPENLDLGAYGTQHNLSMYKECSRPPHPLQFILPLSVVIKPHLSQLKMKFVLVASLFMSVAITAAVPTSIEAVIQYPEVIPGIGLPSLASLNLTSADLYNANFQPGN
jgi:hypothetical protein